MLFKLVLPPESIETNLFAVVELPKVRSPEATKYVSRPAKSTPDPVVTAALAPVVSIRISWLAAILSVPVWNAPEDSTRMLAALTALVMVTVDADEISATSPPVEVRVAPVMFEMVPVPERVMSPPA